MTWHISLKEEVTTLCGFSPDGRWLLGIKDGTKRGGSRLQLWEARTGAAGPSHLVSGYVRMAHWLPTSRTVLCNWGEAVWDLPAPDGEEEQSCADVRSPGSRFLFVSQGKQRFVLDTLARNDFARWPPFGDGCLCARPVSGNWFAMLRGESLESGLRPYLAVIDDRSWKERWHWLGEDEDMFDNIFVLDQKHVAITRIHEPNFSPLPARTLVFDIEEGRLCDRFDAAVVGIDDSSSGGRFVVYDKDHYEVWGPGNQRLRLPDLRLAKHWHPPITPASFTPDGRRIILAGYSMNYAVSEWGPYSSGVFDAETGELILDVDGFGWLSRDGGLIGILSDSETRLQLYETDQGTMAADISVSGENRTLGVPVFSMDSRRVALTVGESGLGVWSRRRPEPWWGIAWLPEFWIALVSGTALLYLGCCSFSRQFQTQE